MACDMYALDMQGKAFGDCRCGFPKTAHKPGGGVPHEEAWAKHAAELHPASTAPVQTGGHDAAEDSGACDNYQVNMSASNFGECVCGKPKAAHVKGGGKPRGSGLGQLKNVAPPMPAPAPAAGAPAEDEYEPGACEHFTLDVTNSAFGMCTCGWKKVDHGKPRKKKAQGDAPAAAVALHPEHAAGHPCDHYEVDVLATKFGNCKCGFSKEEHRAAGTFVEREHTVFAGGTAHVDAAMKRPTVVQPKRQGKQDKPCHHYQVDVNAKTFGDCLCGHAKAKHKEFGGHEEESAPAPAAPQHVEEVIIRDGVHPCAKFELDMKNTGGYGHCLCGFSRKDHESFHHDPDEWKKVKSALTAPKEFT